MLEGGLKGCTHPQHVGKVYEHMRCLAVLAAHVETHGYDMLDVPTFCKLELVSKTEVPLGGSDDSVRKVERMLIVSKQSLSPLQSEVGGFEATCAAVRTRNTNTSWIEGAE